MRLLFLTPQLPYPPRQGTALRNWGLIRELSARHEITVLSFDEQDSSGATADLPSRRPIEVVTAPLPRRTPTDRLKTLLLRRDPDLAWRLASDDYQAALREILSAKLFDVIQVEGLELARYLPAIKNTGGGRLLVYDAHNAETHLQRTAFEADRRNPARWHAALYSLIQTRRLARFEAETLHRADRVLCVSEEDSRTLRALAPQVKPIIVPNGIDLAEYDQSSAISYQLPVISDQSPITDHRSLITFTGKLDYRPNIDAALWFAEEIFPRVRAQCPAATFWIVGQRPARRVQALASRPGVVVTGAVPDVKPYLAAAAVYVAPLRMGGGTRFKLLEAMAMRKAIVSTPRGAEGFAVENGVHLLIADHPHQFADAILNLLAEEQKRAALGKAARRWVERYDWAEIVPRVENSYQ